LYQIPLLISKFEVTLHDLLNMLREAESAIKKEKLVLYISETKKKRKANKTQKKGKGKERSRRVKVTKKDPTKDKILYFHCGKDKYWKKNCNDYLAENVK
ncbi:hypothetical protein B296_00013475, partial [Ensete ventricosum]